MKILGMLRISYIFDKRNKTQYEGDDFLAYLIINTYRSDNVILVSSDKDFNQLLNKNVRILNPRKMKLFEWAIVKNSSVIIHMRLFSILQW